jgi:hypothetical protein
VTTLSDPRDHECVARGSFPNAGALLRVPCSFPFFHPLQHCLFVRPGTSMATAARSLSPCVCIAPFSLLSTSAEHLPVRSFAWSMPEIPSIHTLTFRSTRNQRGNCDPILATMHLYRTLQLAVFICCPSTCASIRLVDAGIQDTSPSFITLSFRSTRNQRGNGIPILATVRFYRILQLAVFVFCPCTRSSSRQGDAGIQEIIPSAITLFFRSTRN